MATDALGSYTETYTTFSGADIVCTFGGVVIGALSGITWSVTREKAPIYTMGSANPRSFSRGKRGIAGSLIFTVFDRPALYDMLYAHRNDGTVQYYTRASNVLPGFQGSSAGNVASIVPVNPITGANGDATLTTQSVDVKTAFPYYADQIPPFDVTITFANEYGQAAVRSIYGLELLNENSGVSMDDIVLEETMTFIARDLGPMVATNTSFTQSVLPSNLSEAVAPNTQTLIPDQYQGQ